MDAETVLIIVDMVEDRIRKLSEIIDESTIESKTKHFKSARLELRMTRYNILKKYNKDMKVGILDV
ncbi:hypothetical protein [Priestia megaterium]|uniref:hypothetical protein n=1 Tax=Priestia megaterium TaxID=1404 RepID=UPI000BFE9691|nr:hypothetical protein [Priestia megaterium]PGO60581.1 hypothetical protein CN981_08515 [Priestia megaterium]